MTHQPIRRLNRNRNRNRSNSTIELLQLDPQPQHLQPITLGRRTDPLNAWISELQHEGLELNLSADNPA